MFYSVEVAGLFKRIDECELVPFHGAMVGCKGYF